MVRVINCCTESSRRHACVTRSHDLCTNAVKLYVIILRTMLLVVRNAMLILKLIIAALGTMVNLLMLMSLLRLWPRLPARAVDAR